jgi:hypothetical protein
MFTGWLSFAGTEVVNEERVRAYVREGLPSLQMPTTCRIDKMDLAKTLDDEPYRTPVIDDAPWVDHDDPDTYQFYGALPLSITGLTDSTRTATVVENMGDGGSTVGARFGTKEVRVTALLVGGNDAAVTAGKRWLTAALAGGCDPCEPGDLCFLLGTAEEGETSLGEYVEDNLPATLLQGQAAYWASGTGTFKPTLSTQYVSTPKAPQPLPCDEIIWTWHIASATVGTTITIESVGESGIVASQSFAVPASGGSYAVSDRGQPSKFSYSQLRVTSAPGETVVINSVDMDYRSTGEEDGCFTKYARQLRRVRALAGPTTIEEYEPTSGAMEKVEFSFVADMPHIYGLEREILSVTGSTIKKNLRHADVFSLDKTVPVCEVPKRPPLIVDPDVPIVPVPPRANISVSAGASDPPYLTSYALAIPDSVIPLWADAVPIMSIRTGPVAARKVQVRFMPRPFETQAPVDLDPCSSCGEFVIDYIPAYSTFVLNGMEERAYIKQSGNRVSDAGHLLSGMTPSTLFSWPVLTCGTGYLAVIDISTSGVGGFDLSVAVRE